LAEFALCLGSITAIGLGQLVPTYAAAAFLGSAALLILLNWRVALRPRPYWIACTILPALAVLSAVWSETPLLTVRYGLQLFATIAAALIIGNFLSPRMAMAAVALSGLFLVALSLSVRHMGGSLEGAALSGIFGSKNQMGFVSQLTIVSSLPVLFDRGQPPAIRACSALGIALSAIALPLTHSAGAIVSLGIGFVLFVIFGAIVAMPARFRAWWIIAVSIGASPLFLLGDYIAGALQNFSTDVLGKDATLTGRTYIWQRAQELIAEHPYLGRGYGAFWRQGNTDAEGIWRFAGIDARAGFNFHNDYIEWTVALGYLGLAAFILTLALITLPLIASQFRAPTVWNAGCIAVVLSILAKSPVESISIWQFNYFSVIVILLAGYSWRRRTPHASSLASSFPRKRPQGHSLGATFSSSR
jgi:exopolysaccharide production protein ExoQ